jgi:polysaccharide deacetylase family protein (PEP-CTERM system associated)
LGLHTHFFTVDVEEYFQVSAFERYVPRESWGSIESRVDASLDRLLELLSERAATATFFVLGCLARDRPWLLDRIVAAGHEVASHGWDHSRVFKQTPPQFRESLRRSKGVLEDRAGTDIIGFRAPSFSIVPGTEWAFDVLLEEGFRYDASLYPIRRPGYGYAAAAGGPTRLERPGGSLMEFPAPTCKLLGLRLPAAGGAYLRLLPYAWSRLALRAAESRGEPAAVYVHPWELDPAQPRLKVDVLTRMRHYGGLARMTARIERLLGEFRFTAIRKHRLAGALRDALT